MHTVTCLLVVLLGGASRSDLRLEDLLPPGLRVLEILPDKEWSIKAAVRVALGVLRRKRVVLPRLERIVVLRELVKNDKLWDALVAGCEDAGVELVDDWLEEEVLMGNNGR